MIENKPSGAYTIDDLPFLMLGVAAHRTMDLIATILGPEGIAEREKAAARRAPGELVDSTDVALSETAREIAEMTLATASTHPTTLRILAESRFLSVRVKIAENPHTPPETLTELARTPRGIIANTAAANPGVPAGELETILLLSDSEAARLGALRNPTVTRHLIEVAAADPSPYVRSCAAHRTTVVTTLERLAADSDAFVRAGAARNLLVPHLSPVQVDALAGDPERGPRAALASNPAAPARALERLAADKDTWVRSAVAKSDALTPAAAALLAGDPDERVRTDLAGNRGCPPALLTALARRRQPAAVREAAAGNLACPADVLYRLAADRSPYVREQADRTLYIHHLGGGLHD
ncbi:hypothetical protein OHA25_61010 (plasmid) [Nonomuraea sp. NBC_00507]|uniref:hypothetical protein n=1 Tax=Nonomuraea sp. NBC_00507 TaxID=2976002 RepID=UPI002E189115